MNHSFQHTILLKLFKTRGRAAILTILCAWINRNKANSKRYKGSRRRIFTKGNPIVGNRVSRQSAKRFMTYLLT